MRILISVLFLTQVLFFVNPRYLRAEESIQEGRVFAIGNYFDKEHTEKEGLKARRVESKCAMDETPPFLKSWCYANSWIGSVYGSFRIFNYKGIRFYAIKGGTAFNADIKFKVGLYGLINSVTFANAASHYKAKITAGIMEYDSMDYDSPLAETVLWAKTNKRELNDWGEDLLWTAAGEILGEAAGEIGGVAVGVVWDTASFALDALDVDEAIAQDAWVEFKDFPVTAGKGYKLFVALDSYVACVGVGAGTVHAYIDFMNHSPHEGDDGGRVLPTRGISIEDVVVTIPEGLPYPDGTGQNRVDLIVRAMDTTDSNPEAGQEITIRAQVENIGLLPAGEFKVALLKGGKGVREESITGLNPNDVRILQWTYTIENAGRHVFMAKADIDKAYNEIDENNNAKDLVINVKARPEPVIVEQTEEEAEETPPLGPIAPETVEVEPEPVPEEPAAQEPEPEKPEPEVVVPWFEKEKTSPPAEKKEKPIEETLKITGFHDIDTPLELGEARGIGVYFKNISGQTLKDINVELTVINKDVMKHLPQYGVGGKRDTWPSVVDGGEFMVIMPYKAVYPGRFSLSVETSVDIKGIKKGIKASRDFTVASEGEKSASYYRVHGADLAIYPADLLIMPEKLNIGEDAVVSVTIRNKGSVDMENVDVLVTADDRRIDSRTLSIVKANSEATFSFTQNGEESGFFQIKARIDPDNKIPEVDEYNNETAKDVKVLSAKEQLEERVAGDVEDKIESKKRSIKQQINDFKKNLQKRREDLQKKQQKFKGLLDSSIRHEGRQEGPELMAKHFIERAPIGREVACSELMSDCNGRALVYVTTRYDEKYKVFLEFNREQSSWHILSASKFGEDEIQSGKSPTLKTNLRTPSSAQKTEFDERFNDICNRLKGTKNTGLILEELSKIKALLDSDKKNAISFVESFKGDGLLMLLNGTLYKTRESKDKESVVSSIKKILNSLFKDKSISYELVKQMDLFGGSEDRGVSIEFLDGEKGESSGFMNENFSEILSLLRDPQKTKALFLLLSLYRFWQYKDAPSYEGDDNDLTPLEYSVKHGIYIPLGSDLYVAPMSESFRRHIIFRMDKKDDFTNAVEILIPGDNKAMRAFIRRGRLDVCRDMYESRGEGCKVIKTHLMAEYPKRVLPVIYGYGDVFKYKKRDPLRIFIHDYSGFSQGRRFTDINEAYCKRVGMTDPKELVEDMLILINQFVKDGYYFDRGGGSDLTTHNFRLCVDAKTRFTGDLDSFHKRRRGAAKDRDIMDIWFDFKRNSIIPWGNLNYQVNNVLRRIGVDPLKFNLSESLKNASKRCKEI